MFCSNCGQQLPDTASFCSKCGTRTQTASTTQRRAATQSAKRPGHWEYTEFTHYEDEPLIIANDKGGGQTPIWHLEGVKDELEFEHRRDGWQLAEDYMDIAKFIREKRFDMTEEPAGGFMSKKKIWTIRSTTLKFKRWVE